MGRGPVDLEQLALARKAQTGVFFTDHLAAFPLSSILRIDCREVDGLIASALVTKNQFRPPTGRDLVNRLVTTQRLKRNSSLKLV